MLDTYTELPEAMRKLWKRSRARGKPNIAVVRRMRGQPKGWGRSGGEETSLRSELNTIREEQEKITDKAQGGTLQDSECSNERVPSM
jgi:hypothetical protein